MKGKLLAFLLFTLSVGVTYAQREISGKVTSGEDGTPLPGVNVVIAGSQQGSITDVDGNYKIAVNEGATLKFSYIGYLDEEFLVGSQSVIDVVMTPDIQQLGEVVVTAYGIEKDTRKIGYAVSTIKSQDITRTAAPSIGSSLYGKAPGLQIQATPGGATSGISLNIRGFASITGNTQPLIVLDGVPIRSGEFNNSSYWNDQRIRANGLADINPADIADITILKGASAAALYGSEANNGVLLITTKSGKGKKGLGIDFSTSFTHDKIAYLPRYQNVRGPGYPTTLADAGQGDDKFIEYDDGSRGLINTSVNFGPKFDGQPVRAWTGEMVPYSAANSSYADLFQNANSQMTSIALSKATDIANVRLSYTRQDNRMISFGSKNNKNVFNLNTSLKLGDRSKTDVTVSYINQFTHNRPYKVDRMINNFSGMMDRFEQADWYFDYYQTSLGYKFRTGSQASATPDENIVYNGFKSAIADYVWRVKRHTEDESNNRVISSITETFEIFKDLHLRGRLANDFTSQELTIEQATEVPLVIGNSGYFGIRQNRFVNLYGDLLLTYDGKITEDLTFSVMGGYSARKETEKYLSSGTSGGLATENYFDLSSSTNQATTSLSRQERVSDAIIGTASVNFKDYLFVEGTVRRDRYSTMNPDNNSFVYPSVNMGFVFSDAFAMPSGITYGKFRASYGVVGNYPGIYEANVAYSQNSLGVQADGGKPAIYTTLPTSNFGNDQIKPEQKHEIELGLEARFLNDRLGFDFAYYNAQIQDQILPLSIAASTGAQSILTNIGTLRNQGLELAITASAIRQQNFGWDIIVNLAKNTNKVEKLANNSTELLHADYDGNAAQLRSVVGRPMGDIYVHPVATDDNGNKIVLPNGLYELDDDMVVAGNAMPKLIGGLLNNLHYGNFTLNAAIDFSYGSSIMPTGMFWMISRGLTEESLNYMDAEHGGLSYYIDADGNGVQTSASSGPNGETVYDDGMLLDGVTAEGEQNTNVIPQSYYYNNTYNWGGPQYSYSRYELYVQKNNYIKMREISLGYTLPGFISEKVGARDVTLSVFGRNLFFIYRSLKDLDPEQTTAGTRWTQNVNTAGMNPSFRSFGVMLSASF